VKIFVIGAGQVGATVVQALHSEHDLTVFDLDGERLAALSQRYDVSTVEATVRAAASLLRRGSRAPTS